MQDNHIHRDVRSSNSSASIQKWGGLASFVMAAALLVGSLLYFTGNLRDAMGPFSYDLADLLYGPVFAASLVMAVFALRERLSESAPRRIDLALPAALVAAAAFVAVACIRASNRHYHLAHPELDLENSYSVLVVWTTLVAGLTGTGWHFLGWVQLLIGSAGWISHRLPRVLSLLYMVGGVASLFVYVFPNNEGFSSLVILVVGCWQGILLLLRKPNPIETSLPEVDASRPGQV